MYVTSSMKVLYAPIWCEEAIPTKEEWQLKWMENAELASLTSKIGEQNETVFKEEWKMFLDYFKNDCKYVSTLRGLD